MAVKAYDRAEDYLRDAFGVEDFDQLIDERMLRKMDSVDMHTAWMFARHDKHVYYSCCGQVLSGWQLQAKGLVWGVDVKAGRTTTCPACGKRAFYAYRGRLSSRSIDEECHVFYRPTRLGELAMICVWHGTTWFDAARTPAAERAEDDAVTRIRTRAHVMELICMPEKGTVMHYRRKFGYAITQHGVWVRDGYAMEAWARIKTANMLLVQSAMTANPDTDTLGFSHHEEIEKALPTDRARYAWRALWEARGELVRDWAELETIRLALRRPNAEMMCRAGMAQLLQPRSWWRGMVNIKAKRLDGVAPLDSNELARLRQSGKTLAPWMLIVPYWAKKLGQPIKLERGMVAAEKHTRGSVTRFDGSVHQEREHSDYKCRQLYEFLASYAPEYGLTGIVRYLNRLEHGQLGTWKDTLGMLEGEEKTDMAMVFPRDLETTHQRLIDRANARRNRPTNDKITEVRERLAKHYTFEAEGLLLQPFGSAEEIMDEGRKQRICIGSYCTRYSDGKTILCKLRKADAPEQPWHAVEFTTTGRLVQCRGYMNKTWAQDEAQLRAFWAAWDQARGEHAAETLQISINMKQMEAVTA